MLLWPAEAWIKSRRTLREGRFARAALRGAGSRSERIVKLKEMAEAKKK